MKQYKTIILAAAVLLGACTKEIEYKGPDSERMLIVNSITEAGQIPVFKVSHSAFFLDPSYRSNVLKSDVSLSVDINGVTRDALYVDSLNGYTDGRALAGGDVISVVATHPKYGTVTTCDTVPYAKNFAFSEYTKEFVITRTMSEMFDDFVYEFDPETVDSVWVTEIEIPTNDDNTNYYMMTIEPVMTYFMYNEYDDDYDTLSQGLHFKIPAETKMLLGLTDATTALLEDTEADSQFEYGRKSFLFDDLYLKDAEKFNFEIVMEKPDTLGWIFTYDEYSYVTNSSTYSIADQIKDEVVYTVNVKLYALSNAYYLYHKSVNDYRNADDISFLSEPVTILHNIKGGAGILATYTGKSFYSSHTNKFK